MNLHVNLCVSSLNVCESKCESVCVGAKIHVNVGDHEWMWLKVCGSTCESVCVGCTYTRECGCS